MLKYGFLFLSLFSLLFILSPSYSSQGERCWAKTFGAKNSDVANCVQETQDSGYLIVGETMSYGKGGKDAWVFKIDANGNKLFGKTFGGVSEDRFHSVRLTRDNGFILAGATYSIGAGLHDVWIIKLDPAGKKEWDRTFGDTNYDIAYSVETTSDGGYIVAGETMSYGAGGTDIWILKLDPSGNKQWDKTYGDKSNDSANAILTSGDSEYIVLGRSETHISGIKEDYGDIRILKIDANGTKKWDKKYGGGSEDNPAGITGTPDGEYIIAGTTKSKGAGGADFWILRLDKSGNKKWDKTFGGPNDDVARSVVRAHNGGYIVVGYTNTPTRGNDIWVVKIDEKGNKIFEKTYGGQGKDEANFIQKTGDGGYILVGFTDSFGAGMADAWVLKLDSSLDCDLANK